MLHGVRLRDGQGRVVPQPLSPGGTGRRTRSASPTPAARRPTAAWTPPRTRTSSATPAGTSPSSSPAPLPGRARRRARHRRPVRLRRHVAERLHRPPAPRPGHRRVARHQLLVGLRATRCSTSSSTATAMVTKTVMVPTSSAADGPRLLAHRRPTSRSSTSRWRSTWTMVSAGSCTPLPLVRRRARPRRAAAARRRRRRRHPLVRRRAVLRVPPAQRLRRRRPSRPRRGPPPRHVPRRSASRGSPRRRCGGGRSIWPPARRTSSSCPTSPSSSPGPTSDAPGAATASGTPPPPVRAKASSGTPPRCASTSRPAPSRPTTTAPDATPASSSSCHARARPREDDGYLVGFVHDDATETTALEILSAQDIEAPPIAAVHIPVRVPFGFHGNWIPDR